MKLSIFITVIFVIFLGFTAFAGLFINLAGEDNYNITISDTFKGAYTNQTELAEFIEDTTAIGVNMTDSAKEAKQLEGDYMDPSKSLVRTTKMTWSAFPVVHKLLVQTSNFLHLPPVILAVIIGILIVSLLFAFISLIFRWLT